MCWIGILFAFLCWKTVCGFRANVTLQLNLSNDIDPECDESVYKVTVCAGEFTDRCKLLGPVTLYVQATCAAQGSPEPISFAVNSVETPIEVEVSVQRIGELSVQRLRRAEIWLTEAGEVSVTSYDLSTIVRITHSYKCLSNYFGNTCQRFCDVKAVEYVCDDLGNPICRPGYFIDPKSGQCRMDQCAVNHKYCQNGGACVANSDPSASQPFCLCPVDYFGPRCEHKQIPTTLTSSETIPTSSSTTPPVLSTDHPRGKLIASTHARGNRSVTRIQSARPERMGLSNYQSNTSRHSVLMQAIDTKPAEQSRAGVNNPAVGEDVEPLFKRIVLPIVVILLMLSLLIACIGFLVWVVLHRRSKAQSSFKPDISPTMPSFHDVPRRWASVDDSPTKVYNFDGRCLNNAVSCLPSINGEPFGLFQAKTDMEPIYGLHSGYHSCGRYFDPISSCNTSNNLLPWMDSSVGFNTLPRQFAPVNRRHTTELGSFLANGSIYANPTAVHDRYLRANTFNIIDPQQLRLERSIITETVPEETSVDQCRSSAIVEGQEDNDEPVIFQTEDGRIPPPPKQFADTYMRSAC